MDQVEASDAIFARWKRLWPGMSGDVPYVFDNIAKPEPELLAIVGIVSLDSEQWTLGPKGNRMWLRPGMIDVRLRGPVGAGRKQLDQLAKVVREIYEGVRFARSKSDGGIVTQATSVNELKRDRDATQLWILSVVTPFEYYETR